MPPPHNQRGAALLTVLMLVAVIAVMAGVALEKLRLSTRLAGNAAAGEQARGYVYAAETMAVTRIGAMLGNNPKRITLAGGWSDRPFGMPLPGGGMAVARVRDGGNCFNVNGLVNGGPGAYATLPEARVPFVRLMRLLDIPVQVAEQIASGAADWIDSDQEQQAMGAEDGAYLARETPYRTADTLMTDPSELRAVAGMTPEIYATLRPWICTLPVARPAAINVNTLMPEQAPLLAMLFPDTMSVEGARQMILKRPPQGVSSPDAFFRSAALQGDANLSGERDTDVVTRWFALDIDVTIGTTQLQERALVDATALPVRLVSRQWGEAS